MALPELDTPRLHLRPTRTRDISWLRELLRDAEVRRTTLHPPRGTLFSWCEAYLQVRLDRRMWAIEEKSTGAAAGWIGVYEGAAGFELRPAYWNRGYMTEALRAVLASRGPAKTEGVVFEGNIASRRVFEKCGFALIRHGLYCGHDCVFYELNGLPGQNRGVADLQTSLAGGQDLARVEPALRIK